MVNKRKKPIGEVKFANERPSVKNKKLDQNVLELESNRAKNGKLLITRRHLIYGAAGIGALALAGAGVKFAGDKLSDESGSLNVLDVKQKDVVPSEKLKEEANNSFMQEDWTLKLPYGSLCWANNSRYICALVPTDKPKPICNINIIDYKSKERNIIKKQAESAHEGFDIYDARANENGIIWTEVNILQGEWRIYVSKFTHDFDLNPQLVDKGSNEWETPSIAVSDKYAYWQVIPQTNGKYNKLKSTLKKTSFDSSKRFIYTCDVESDKDYDGQENIVVQSKGKMSSPIYGCNDGVVITPRADAKQVFYQLLHIDNNGKTTDTLTLPQSMKPLQGGYGDTGFNFAFDAIYTQNAGLSNLGTYTKFNKNDNKWLNFTRTPTAAPCWSNGYFVIRSTMSICCVNLNSESYCILDRPNASEDYGDYLASSGNCDTIVTYANIHDHPVTGEETKYCLLRTWTKA